MRVTASWVSMAIAIGLALAPGVGGKPALAAPLIHYRLPRYRLGPNGENATPAPDSHQSLKPYRIELARPKLASTACDVAAPPEYSPSAGILLEYGAGWEDVVAHIVAALTGPAQHDEIAWVVVDSASGQQTATSHFQSLGANLAKVRFIQYFTDSVWLRDYGPHFVWQNGADAIVDSHYYEGRPLDNFFPTILAEDHFLLPSYAMGLYYSGGNFQPTTDRQGFITTLIDYDNPGFGTPYISLLYETFQGIDTLHVLPIMPGNVDETGHIDMWMYLVDEDTAVISEFLPGSDATAIAITNNAVPYMEALGYDVVRTPAWNDAAGIHYTYTNAFRVNDRIFVPAYGTLYGAGDAAYNARDTQALAAWQTAAGPGVEIVPIDSYDLITGAGAVHCIVMQVPRRVDPLPAACITSPAGGELLVPNTAHEIHWTATDASGVTGVDLAYSKDGGVTFPPEQEIATGVPDTGKFVWTVPQVESGEVRVRVVAHDGDANATAAAGPADTTIAPALQHTYTFASGAGVNKHVFGNKTTSWAELDGIRRPAAANSELSGGNYTRLSASDQSRYSSQAPGTGRESTHIFELAVTEDPAKIVDIGILWEGYAADAAQMEMYVWDYVASQWCDGRGSCGENHYADNFAGNRDKQLTAHLRDNIARYIGPGGQMTVLLYAERYGDSSFHDYFALTVTYEACSGPDADFDGYADLCDNCPATANATQTDTDADLHGNACDCSPSNANVFASPLEIGNVTFLSDKDTLVWDSDAPHSGSATVYDVLRGEIVQLPLGAGASCLVSDTSSTTRSGLGAPPPDAGYYYLVRGSNSCGIGSYGADSAGQPRVSTACP